MGTNEALAALGATRDWEYTKPEPDTTLMFVHREVTDGDIYFVDNRLDRAENVNAIFRVDGKAPEIWDPATGAAQPASYSTTVDGRTTVRLHLDPYGTAFVVFRAPAKAASLEIAEPQETVLAGLGGTLNQEWHVSFQAGRGAPETAEFDGLTSWSENADAGIKYFSGTATYSKTFEVPARAFAPGAHLWLDLGDVRDVAEVTVNGKDLGILWKAPFKIDVTGVLTPGSNQLVFQVTNLWVNRMIGDQQPWALKKYAFADFTPYKADSPLLPSGLLGPVRLIAVTVP
jgi:hypothetical protein